MQLAAQVEVDDTRHVDAEMVRPHIRALNTALAEEVKRMQLDLLAERHHADDGRRSAGREHRKRLFRGFLRAEDFETMLHAALRELLYLLHRIAIARIHEIGGADFGG